MCKTKPVASKNHFFNQIINFFVGPLGVPWRSPEGPLEVPDVKTFRGPSGGVPGTSRAGWVTPGRKTFFQIHKVNVVKIDKICQELLSSHFVTQSLKLELVLVRLQLLRCEQVFCNIKYYVVINQSICGHPV